MKYFDELVFTLVAILLLACLLLNSCAKVDVSDSKHEIGGEATVHIEIDFSACSDLPDAEQVECIRTILATLKKGSDNASASESQSIPVN
jgi:hypothetical protein